MAMDRFSRPKAVEPGLGLGGFLSGHGGQTGADVIPFFLPGLLHQFEIGLGAGGLEIFRLIDPVVPERCFYVQAPGVLGDCQQRNAERQKKDDEA